MKQKTIVLLMAIFMLTAVYAGQALAEPKLKQITESVYSYEGIPANTPGNTFSANAGIVVGEDAVLVVDTLTSAKEAENFLKDIRAVTDKPIRYVVNTHYHLDHSLGNSVFADLGARIISHNTCRNTIIKDGDQALKNPVMYGLPKDFWEGTRVIAPDIAFEREMVIELDSKLTIKLIHSGVPSHSLGSIFVHVVEQDVLFTGDILFTDFHPFLGEGNFEGWFKTLDMISSMNIKNIIPGHGPLSSNKDLQDMKTYLSFFDEKAKELSAKESNPEKLAQEMLKILPKRSGGDFIVGMNIKMRYVKKAGEKSETTK